MRGGANRLEQGLQVVLEIAVVGEAGFRREVHSHLDVVVFQLERLRESGKGAERALAEDFGLLIARKAQQRLPQLGCKQRRKRTTLRRLDKLANLVQTDAGSTRHLAFSPINPSRKTP